MTDKHERPSDAALAKAFREAVTRFYFISTQDFRDRIEWITNRAYEIDKVFVCTGDQVRCFDGNGCECAILGNNAALQDAERPAQSDDSARLNDLEALIPEVIESCESGYLHCWPVEHYDNEGTPLCTRCWDDLISESTVEIDAEQPCKSTAKRVARLQEAEAGDTARLDSGMITIGERDRFGNVTAITYSGIDLRAGIDAAMREVGGG